MTKRALIAGASIAGPVTAYWLIRHGWDVTIIERAPALRLGGQNIDISDAAVDIIRKMGIEEAIKARHTGEKGLQFVDTHNRCRAQFPVGQKGSMTREIEILRGDLVTILAAATSDRADYRFGRSIHALDNREDGVNVTFDDRSQENFDIVIAADGMNSTTRPMIIGDGAHESYLGCWSSYFTVPRVSQDNDWWRWYTSPTGVIAFLRPDSQGTMRASVNFLAKESDASVMSLEDKKTALQKRLRGAGWQCDRLAEALDQVDDVFLGPLHQIKADHWSKGRCALVGDAAYCPTPYTGMGTTLAVIGAYILAKELSETDHHSTAFANYEAKFRPFAEKSQDLPPGVPKLAYAHSKFKVGLINAGAGFVASKPVQKFFSLFSNGDKNSENAFTLPSYKD